MNLGSRKDAGGASAMILMVLAFAGIGGFLYWLNQSAVSSQVIIEEEPDAEATATGGTMLTFAEFATDPSAYPDQEVSVTGVSVVSLMGAHAFWTELDQNRPFLVRVDPGLFAQGLTFEQGAMATIQGTVKVMSDSILNAWEAGGSFTNEGQRFEAEFAETFFEATAVDIGG